MPSREGSQLKRVLHAYHEAGHAVVWHVVGGLVEEVSIASSQAGYKGYCRFGFLFPQGDDPPSPDEWLKRWQNRSSAVEALATKLLKHRTLDGRDAHFIIWRTTGYPDADWRFGALNVR